MISEEDKAEFRKGVNDGSKKFSIALPAAAQADVLFPLWKDAIHRIFIRHGCSCHRGVYDNCFGVLTREAQIALMENNSFLSFQNFLSLFDEARLLFFTGKGP